MPLPSPNKDEDRRDFNNRCMANVEMNKEFPNSSQRFAVCLNLWEKHKVSKLSEELSKK